MEEIYSLKKKTIVSLPNKNNFTLKGFLALVSFFIMSIDGVYG